MSTRLRFRVGLKRTASHTLEEGQQHWRDLSAARAKLHMLLTELRLIADQPVYNCAARLSAFQYEYGDKALDGEDSPSTDQLLELQEALIEAMRSDLEH